MSAADSDAECMPDSERLPPIKKTSKDVPPQQTIDNFRKKFTTKHPGKPFTVLPNNLYAKRAAFQASRKGAPSKNAIASYEQAAAICKARVRSAVESDVHIQKLTLDDISDDGLGSSSDIDVPSNNSPGTDSDSDTDEPIPTPAAPFQSSEIPADDFTDDPWNAVCVSGLRLYTKGSQAEIEVVRKQDEGETVESKKLDVDDQAADATKRLQKSRLMEEQQ